MLIQAMGEFIMCYQDVKAFLTLEKMRQFNQHNTAIQSQILISDVTSCKSHFLSSEATKEAKEGQTVLTKYAHKNCVCACACIRIKSCSKSSFYFTVLFQLVCL